MTESGDIRDGASPRLAILRRDIRHAHERLLARLERIVAGSEHRPFLQEPLVTTRGGRYVIPLKAGFKGRIPGIVHDSSASGATLFIEPLATVELNNTWRELQLDEEKEVRRILTALTAQVGEAAEAIVRTVDALAQLDPATRSSSGQSSLFSYPSALARTRRAACCASRARAIRCWRGRWCPSTWCWSGIPGCW